MKKYPIAKADRGVIRKTKATKAEPKVEPKRHNMKCPNCKKDYKAGVKAAYKLGLLEGENRLQTTINCIRKTNRHLLEELLRLDKEKPLGDRSIKMSRDYAEKLIKTMKRANRLDRADQIQAMIDEQIHTEVILE